MELTKEHFDLEMGKLTSRMTSMESSVTSLELNIKEVKATVDKIDKRDKEDSDAFAKDIVELQKDVKQFKLKHA